MSSYTLFAGSSHPKLGAEIAETLGVKLGRLAIETYPDQEIGVQVLENVRGKEVFLLQSLARRPNHYLMELLILIDALKRASARGITAVIPYYAYARQDRKEKGRVPITAKLVANLLVTAGVTRVMTMDLHTEQIQGFFDIPVDHLYARPLLVEAVKRKGWKDIVVVAPDVGATRMARKYAEALGVEFAIVDKRRVNATNVEAKRLVGSVKGKTALLVDDICSTGGTLKLAARVCRDEGAKQVYAAVSHGLLLGNSWEQSGLDGLITTNTVPADSEVKGIHVERTSVAPLVGKAIECVVHARSISSLFN